MEWAVSRSRRATKIDEVVVATSNAERDDAIEECCASLEVRCFRGSERDVLGRFVAAAEHFDAGWVVRINADNPFIDPAYLDRLLVEAVRGQHDYVSYSLGSGKPVMLAPVGFFAEVISRPCLTRAQDLIADVSEREHVTLGIYRRPGTFKVQFLGLPSLFDRPCLRFTLDTFKDLGLFRDIVSVLGEHALEAAAEEFVRLIEERKDWQDVMSAENARNPKATQ